MTTRQVSALRFDHHATFVDFVRQYGRAERQGEFELYECAWAGQGPPPPDEPERVYVLTRADRPWSSSVAGARSTVAVEDGRLWMDGGEKARPYLALASRKADRLPALVGPIEGREVAPHVVVFWFDEQATFQRLVSASFQLGCDRLQAAAVDVLDEAGQAEGRRVYLLRAERPSYYVIDQALAWPDARVYVPEATGHLMVPFGTHHPLADLWAADGEEVTFLDGLGPHLTVHRVAPPQWTDIYGLTEFNLEGLVADEAWASSGEAPGRFTVPLSLIPSHKVRDVQVWMLGADERGRLERLLSLIPEQDLHVLQFTAQETPDGRTMLFVRERHTGVGREYIDFEGERFAPYAGYPNLLLPVDRSLEPPLRKDRYREIFALRPREMVFLWQDGGRDLRLVRLAESSFRPLPDLVDYIVSAGMESLKAIEARAVFDFQQYETAPRRPTKAAPATPQRPARVDEGEEEDEAPRARGDAAEAAPQQTPAAAELVVPEQGTGDEEVVQSELELREVALEQDVVVEGQTVERWVELAEVKRRLDKVDDEVLATKEALWLTFEAQADPEPLHRQVVEAYERLPAFGLADLPEAARRERAVAMLGQEDADIGWTWLFFAYEGQEASADAAVSRRSGQLREFLSTAYRVLDQGERRIRFKDRWLLWRGLFALNHDAMQEAKVRESLLLELTQHGLQPFDIPHFIQNRIYQSRFIHDDDPDAENEFLVANTILDNVAARLEGAQDEVLRRIGAAILAYGYERLGNRARADQYFAQAEGFFESATGLSHIEQAWIALYLGAARQLQQPGSENSWVRRYNDKLRQHAAADLAHSELEVLQSSIFKRAEAASPSEFFTPDNFRSLFPTSGKYTEAQQIKRELDELINAGKFNQALAEMRGLAQRAVEGNFKLDARQFAWLLGPITDALRRIGQAVEGIEILSAFEQSVDRIRTRNLLGLYTTLLRLKLAEGYLDLGEEVRGTELIQLVVHDAYRNKELQWLDHLDMLGAALESIEVVPLAQRTGAVTEVLNALFITEEHPQDSVNYRPIKLRLIDHCVEVALSKEKLSLKRYKLYLDEDEFHVRYRIVNDKVTAEG